MPTTVATWNSVELAKADENTTQLLEGNTYFPVASVEMEYLKENGDTYTCPWKGLCNYYDITVNGKTNAGAAWIYKEPKDAAKQIKGHVAFWKGVQVSTK